MPGAAAIALLLLLVGAAAGLPFGLLPFLGLLFLFLIVGSGSGAALRVAWPRPWLAGVENARGVALLSARAPIDRKAES